MSRVPLAHALDDLARLARMRGDLTEVALLDRAAAAVRVRGIDDEAGLTTIVEAPEAAPDLDPDVLARLRQVHIAGAWVLFESAVADLPVDLRWLFESGAVDLRQLARLNDDLGLHTKGDLATAVEEHRISAADGLGPSLERAVEGALPALRAGVPRVPLGHAVSVSEPLIAALQETGLAAHVGPVGSLRRFQDQVGDLEILAVTEQPESLAGRMAGRPGVTRCLHRSREALILLLDRLQIAIRFVPPSQAGAALVHHTGSVAHVRRLRALAAERGLTLTASGLTAVSGGRPIAVADEGAVYGALGLSFVAPELRESGEEIDAALHGTLPRLLERTDIRGDLHMHTSWSDGRDTVERMAAACRDLGYAYIAITDHSQRSASSRNLQARDIGRQADDIAAARERVPGIAILHGCEVDIMPDGTLDFTDAQLETFDIVIASLHERANQSEAELMSRYLGALHHPLVNIISHPTNRLIPHRPGYALDYDRLIAEAVATGTVLEVDGAPAHLDMDGALARRAIAGGATVCVDSDCHRAELLGRQMTLAVATARRGWVEPRHVLNARALDEVRECVARKREGR